MDANEQIWVGLLVLWLGLVVLWAGMNSLRQSASGDPRYGRITRGSGLLQTVGAPILIIVGLVQILQADADNSGHNIWVGLIVIGLGLIAFWAG